MIQWELDFERCLRSKGIDCRNCVWSCPTNVLGIKANKVTFGKEEDCILCTSCVGNCLVDDSVVKVWDDENPLLTKPPSILKKLAEFK